MKLGKAPIVFRKELLDQLRDHRTLISMIVIPILLFPVLVIGTGYLLSKWKERTEREKIPIMLLGAEHAPALRAAGLHRLTISLDTLRPDRFRALTGRDNLAAVLEGIRAAADAGFTGTKLDSVLLRGSNDDELFDLLEFSRHAGIEVRFLEYMDVAGATRWTLDQVFTRAEILAALTQRYGRVEPLAENGSAPAQRFCLPDGTTFGIIASTTTPFCRTCDRSRLTSDGLWFLCLYATRGLDLRRPLRKGASPEEIRHLIQQAWQQRDARGAELRKQVPDRCAFIPLEGLRRDPHLEMHTRGG